jgi:Berberine and berberine like
VFERLQALKRRYDPTNVLHRNQNIPPANPVGAHEVPAAEEDGR